MEPPLFFCETDFASDDKCKTPKSFQNTAKVHKHKQARPTLLQNQRLKRSPPMIQLRDIPPPGLIGLFIPILACYQVNKEANQRENQIEANFNPIIKSPKCFLRFDFLPVSKTRRPPRCSKVQSCFGKFINRIQIGATFCRW